MIFAAIYVFFVLFTPNPPNMMIGLYGFHDEWSLWLPWSNQKQVILFIMWFPSRVDGGVMFMSEIFVFRRHNQFQYFIIWADINLNSIFHYFFSSFWCNFHSFIVCSFAVITILRFHSSILDLLFLIIRPYFSKGRNTWHLPVFQ